MGGAMDSSEALARLKAGNERFVGQSTNTGDVSPARRAELAQDGQHPFAVVVACSDSRVVPEHLFDCGLGELFCIRTAGNTIGPAELASIVYACAHLGCKLVVVLGHTQCGAVGAALAGGEKGPIGVLTDRVLAAIGAERDPSSASVLNVKAGIAVLEKCLEVTALKESGLLLQGALHHIDTGQVEFL